MRKEEASSYYVHYWTAKLATIYNLHNFELHRSSEDCMFVCSGAKQRRGRRSDLDGVRARPIFAKMWEKFTKYSNILRKRSENGTFG